MINLRSQLDRERRLRLVLEQQQNRMYETPMYVEQPQPKPKEYVSNMQAKMEKDKIVSCRM